MKNIILSAFAASLIGVACLVSACGLSQGQQISALVQAGGQAYGAYYLTSQEVNGVVPPEVLAQYEKNLIGISNVMAGGLDAYTFQNIIAQVTKSPAVTPQQASAIGFLSSVNSTFIRANSSPLTIDGARVQAAAEQLASGLAAAINQVTGTTFVIPGT